MLSTWTDVQRKWQALQSIFVGSADIRTQLPADSARFDTLDAGFRVPSPFSSAQAAAMQAASSETSQGANLLQ